MKSKLLLFLTAVLLASTMMASADEQATETKPLESDVAEEVTVARSTVLFQIFRKNDNLINPEFCRNLGPDDFVFRLNNKTKQPEAIDYLGDLSFTLNPELRDRWIVFLFDEEHFNGKPSGLEWCITRDEVYDEARKAIALMQPGDHFSFLAIAYGVFPSPYGWVETQAEALAAIDWIEDNVPTPRYASDETLSHHLQFRHWDDLQLAIESLAITDVDKEILLFAADFIPRLSYSKLSQLSIWTSASRSPLSVVDVISNRRVMPIQLHTVAEHGGGRLYSNLRDASTAIGEPKETSACRFQAVFPVSASEVNDQVNQFRIAFYPKGYRISYPKAIQSPFLIKSPKARLINLLAVREPIKQGIAITTRLDLNPAKYDEKHSGDLYLTLSGTEDLRPEDIGGGIAVDAILWTAARFGKRAKILASLPKDYQITEQNDLATIMNGSFAIRIPGENIPAGEKIEVVASAVSVTNDRVVAHEYQSLVVQAGRTRNTSRLPSPVTE